MVSAEPKNVPTTPEQQQEETQLDDASSPRADPVSPRIVPAKERQASCVPPDLHTELSGVLERIQAVRKRPLFALITPSIREPVLREVHSWRRELREAGRDGPLDILIDSPGGLLSVCYQVARFLSNCTKRWDALVPNEAASGATLICLGSNEIVMSQVAQLSPLDPQVISKRREKFFLFERQSPLEAFEAVRYVQQFTLTAVSATMEYLLDPKRGPITPNRALEAATTISTQLARPILERIEPYDLGAFSLDARLVRHYCERVASPEDSSKQTQRLAQFGTLVDRYPAHETVIDIAEAKALKINASEPIDELEDLFIELRATLPGVKTFIGMIVPSDTGNPE